MRPSPTRTHAALISGTVILATATSWFLVGDQSTRPLYPQESNRPLTVSGSVARALGIAGLVLTPIAYAAVEREMRAGRLSGAWRPVLLSLSVIGVAAAWTWRVMTARVVGANIGAGLLLLFVVPLLAPAAAWAIGRAVTLIARR
ncbi:MAG: hypothetical protein QOC60_1229 [Frankiaceae bacterium]|jgi:hypothetical protein|nr:hypothetical protein [Frankiaceae bacterium]MDQ1715284.1 hypothetical protein [Frankiaceae bacterium]